MHVLLDIGTHTGTHRHTILQQKVKKARLGAHATHRAGHTHIHIHTYVTQRKYDWEHTHAMQKKGRIKAAVQSIFRPVRPEAKVWITHSEVRKACM